jgi:hypothetical protein
MPDPSSYGRVPPQDLDAERAVLGALLGPDGLEAWRRLSETSLRADDFYRLTHREIYRRAAFFAVQGRDPDPTLVAAWLGNAPGFESREDAFGLLLELAGASHTIANVDFYANRVRAEALRRSIIRQATDLVSRAYELNGDETVGDLVAGAVEDLRTISDGALDGKPFPTETGARFLEVDPGPRPLLVGHEVLGLGEWILLLGEEKLGKSMLSLDLALALVGDEDREAIWCGFNVFGGRRVLYLVGEGGRRGFYGRLRKRSKDLSADEVDRLHIWLPSPDLLSIEKPEEFSLLRNYVVENGIKLVVLDPLAHFHGCDENSNSEMRDVAGRFISLTTSTGAALVVVHHTRKSSVSSRRGSARESRGASSVPAAADGSIVFEAEHPDDEQNPNRRMTFSLRHAENEPEPRLVALDRETLRFRLVTPSLGGRPATHDVGVPEILAYLDENPGQTYEEIRTGLSVPMRSLQRWLPDLLRRGDVERDRDNARAPYRWFLPREEDGKSGEPQQEEMFDGPRNEGSS